MTNPQLEPATRYRVLIACELDASWAGSFHEWHITASDGTTALERVGADQAALYGLLLRLRDLGLVLLAVERLNTS